MKFNYGLERKRFDEEWAKLRKEYAVAGMADDAIQQMYEFDLAVFRRRRVDAIHEQSFAVFEHESDEDNPETNNPLYKHHLEAFSTMGDYPRQGDRFSWIEQISDMALYKRLSLLSDEDKELLTLFTQDGLSKREIAKIRNVTEQAIGQKIKRLKQFLSF